MTRARAHATAKKKKAPKGVVFDPILKQWRPKPAAQSMPGGNTMTTQSGLAMGFGPVVSTLQSATQAANKQAATRDAQRANTTRGDPTNARS